MQPSSMQVKRRIEWGGENSGNRCPHNFRPSQPQGASPGSHTTQRNGTGASAQTAQVTANSGAPDFAANALDEMDALSALLEGEEVEV